MVAAVTVADDPVLVLGPALAGHLHVSLSWSGWFIAALGAGTVIGSFLPSLHTPSIRLAATALAALAVCMMAFVHVALGVGLFLRRVRRGRDMPDRQLGDAYGAGHQGRAGT